MGVKLPRKKNRSLFVSILYRLIHLPLPNEAKFRLFLNLEWIFDRLSHEMSFRIYQPHNHPVRTHSIKFILDFIDESQVVLDLGSNLGDISNIIADRARKVVGVDHSRAAIEVAKERYQRDNLIFVHSDAIHYLQGTDEKFDVLILSHILEHLDDPAGLLLRFKCYFKYVYIELPDFDRYHLNHYRKDLEMSLIYSDNDHISEFDRQELGELLDNCGLTILRSEYIFGLQKLWCRVD
jgi:SAM-dependent methyltransferase